MKIFFPFAIGALIFLLQWSIPYCIELYYWITKKK